MFRLLAYRFAIRTHSRCEGPLWADSTNSAAESECLLLLSGRSQPVPVGGGRLAVEWVGLCYEISGRVRPKYTALDGKKEAVNLCYE